MRFEFLGLLRSLVLTDSRALFACLSLGFLVRLVPEVLAFPFPIGSDTIHYAVVMQSGVVWAHWSQFFTVSWLFYALTVPVYGVVQGDPFMILKVVAPLLFGLNVAGVYWFSRKMLGWSVLMGVVAGVFFAFQLATLRISWDLLRNTLGLGVLLFALAYMKDVGSKRGFALFSVLGLLSVFAHEYAAVTLLVVVCGLAGWRLVKGAMDSVSRRWLLGVLPALSVFLVGLGLRFFPVRFVTQSNVVGAGDSVSGSSGLFFFVNYLQVDTSVDSYLIFGNLAFSVGLLFAVLFLPYLVLVVKGHFRDGVLNLWTGLLLVGAFGCLFVPVFALQYWHRWMFMLAYPFTFFAVMGLRRVYGGLRERRVRLYSRFLGKMPVVMVLLTFGLSIAYLFTPLVMGYAGTSVPSETCTYAYFSTAPNVPYEDGQSVVDALNWLDNNVDCSSAVVLQHTFVDWGKLCLDDSHEIVSFNSDVDQAVSTAFSNGFDSVFFVWWNQPIGWYGVSVPDYFVSVQDFGRISVYAYEGVNFGN